MDVEIFPISYNTVLVFLQRLERGENVDDEETFGQGDGDAQDKLSGQLGIELAVKVTCWVNKVTQMSRPVRKVKALIKRYTMMYVVD